MEFIHFIVDDKFLNDTICLFNSIDIINNRYIIVTHKTEFTYLKDDFIEIVNKDQASAIISNPKSCDALFIHGLSSLNYDIIELVHPKICVFWFSWGYDIYSNRYPQFKLIKIHHRIKTEHLSYSIAKAIYKEEFKDFLKRLLGKDKFYKDKFISGINRIDFYSGVFPMEYEMLKLHKFFKAAPVRFNYPTPKGIFNTDKIIHANLPTGQNIQVGNSASLLCNHCYILNLLKKCDTGEKKIIVPLSYQKNEDYVDYVCKKGYSYFGKRFIPIKEFIPYKEYQELLSSVAFSVYGYKQQASVGNILLNIRSGVKIFLPQKSFNYIHFKKIGYKVCTIEHDLANEIQHPLSEQEVYDNRSILIKYSTDEIYENNILNIVNKVKAFKARIAI